MNTKTLSFSLGVPMAFLLGWAVPLAQGPAGLDLTKLMGIVDMDKARRAYPKAREYQEELRREAAELDARLKKEQEALNELQMNLQKYDRLTKEWIEGDAKINGEKARLERWAKLENARLAENRFRRLVEISETISAAVKKLAEERGVQMVVHLRTPPEDADAGQRLEVHQLNDVIYYAAALDLTDDVIKILIK
jgi:Skp family chaperone for outer membrane proteins